MPEDEPSDDYDPKSASPPISRLWRAERVLKETEKKIEESPSGSLREQANEVYEKGRQKLRETEPEAAIELAERAKRLAEGRPLSLLREGKKAVKEGREAMSCEPARAVEKFEQALDCYERVRELEEVHHEYSLDGDEGVIDWEHVREEYLEQGDIDDAIGDVEDLLAAAEVEKTRKTVTNERERAAELRARAAEKRDNGEFQDAKSEFEDAKRHYETALEEARKHDLDTASSLRTRIEQMNDHIENCKHNSIEQQINKAWTLLRSGNYDQAKDEFEELRETLNSEFGDEDDVGELRQRIQRGRVRAKQEIGIDRFQAAMKRARAGSYLDALGQFNGTKNYLENVQALAIDCNLDRLRIKTEELVETSDHNATCAYMRLFPTQEDVPEFVTLDDLGRRTSEEASRTETPVTLRARPDSAEEMDVGDLSLPDEQTAKLPPHEVLDEFNSGRFASVQKVELKDSDEIAALKRPQFDEPLSDDDVKQFLAAVKYWSDKDDHKNIVTIYDFGYDTEPWLLMECAEGGDLSNLVGGLSIKGSLEVLVSTAEALSYATRDPPISHLDVKPTNVLLAEDGTPKLTDWQLAWVAFQHEATDTRMGVTAPYAAPEQIDGSQEVGDDKTDIYQFGVTGYKLVTGQLPFEPKSSKPLDQQILNDDPMPPSEKAESDVPEKLDEVLLKAMEKEPSKRHEEKVQLRDDLQAVFDEWKR